MQDKLSHPYELLQVGFEFTVVPHIFVTHFDSTGMGAPWCEKFNIVKEIFFPSKIMFLSSTLFLLFLKIMKSLGQH